MGENKSGRFVVPKWLILAAVAVALVLIGGNMWWSDSPPGGSGPWVFTLVVGLFVGVASAVSLAQSFSK